MDVRIGCMDGMYVRMSCMDGWMDGWMDGEACQCSQAAKDHLNLSLRTLLNILSGSEQLATGMP